jgi:molybdate transport system permease protein
VDWQALQLSLTLATATSILLLIVGVLLARTLAWQQFKGRVLVEALVTLPLVLPPTVLGFYLLVLFSPDGWLGQLFVSITGNTLAFSFSGLLLASMIYSLPFAVQPMLRAFEGIPPHLREAAWCCGLNRWQTFWRIELPLAWPGVVSAMALVFAHTLGEFGVVLMVGGNIPGETRTIAIAIYDRVQALDDAAANTMSLTLLGLALATIALVYALNRKLEVRHARA